MESPKTSTIRDMVYRTMREELCEGVFAPGQRMNEVDLTKRYMVSRSPVREALRQLAADGLVEEIPNRGCFARAYTAKDMQDIYDVRLVLEGAAILRLTPDIADAAAEEWLGLLENMHQAKAQANLELYTEMDRRLHSSLVNHCGNALLIDMYNRVEYQFRQFRRFSLKDAKRREESLVEHEQTIRMILSGNLEAAKILNGEHLLRANEKILLYLEALQGSGE